MLQPHTTLPPGRGAAMLEAHRLLDVDGEMCGRLARNGFEALARELMRQRGEAL